MIVAFRYNRSLAKLSKAVKIADASDEGETESEAISTIAIAFGDDTESFDKTMACSTKMRFFDISRFTLRSCLESG